jgi:tripartite-type tricarboxylate transporter receptor subunit TctC
MPRPNTLADRLVLLLTVLPIALTAAAAAAVPIPYPVRPVRIVTNEPGAGLDFIARLIAAELVARATPDGHTLLWHNNAIWTQPLLKSVPYDPLRDLAPITQGTLAPNILVVHPTVPAKSMSEFLTLLKARPGEINFVSGGAGSPTHLAAALFSHMANINIVHIPYKGSGPAMTALLGGEGHMMFSVSNGGLPHIKDAGIRSD